MALESLNPFIRYANLHAYYAPQKKNSVCYDCRLFYILNGEGKFFANGGNYSFSPNTAIYLPPLSEYRFFFDQPKHTKFYVLNFDLTDKFSNLSKCLGTTIEGEIDETKVPKYQIEQEFSKTILLKNGIGIRNYAEKCVNEFLKKNFFYSPFTSANLKLALIEMLKQNDSQDSNYSFVQSVTEYIRDNFNNPELSNQQIATRFGYHPYHLNRIFKSATQKTLHGYLLDYRIHIAKTYLITTDLNITAISEQIGFISYTYFIKLFREKTGQSPLKYRRTHKHIGV